MGGEACAHVQAKAKGARGLSYEGLSTPRSPEGVDMGWIWALLMSAILCYAAHAWRSYRHELRRMSAEERADHEAEIGRDWQ